MKSTIIVLFSVLFTIMMIACDSVTNGGSNGQDTVMISHDDYTPSSDSIVCDKCEDRQTHKDADDPTGDDTIHVDTVDPLTDYYWLVGQWQREEDKLIYDITVKGWDNEKGAQVEGFSPCSPGYAIETDDENQLLFYGQSPMGDVKCSNGKIDVTNKKNQITAISDWGETITLTYIKL